MQKPNISYAASKNCISLDKYQTSEEQLAKEENLPIKTEETDLNEAK